MGGPLDRLGPVRPWLPWVLCLSGLTLLAYWPVGGHDFIVYDDPGYVSENPALRGDWSGEALCWAWTTTHLSNWHPLTWMSLMLDRRLFGLYPGGYHWTNLLLHLAAGLILFAALRRMTGYTGRSGIVAAFFLLHPLHVESVAWISERKDVLSALFGMLGLWAYAWYAERPVRHRYALVGFALVLGLLAKPMVVTFPFVLLLMDWWPLRRPMGKGVEIWSLVREKIPLLVLSLASATITFCVQHRSGAVAPLEALPLASRLSNAVVAYAQYVRKTFWPFDLAAFYPYHQPATQSSLWLSLSLLLLVTLWALSQYRRRPYVPVGWLWYLGTLVPVIGIVQVGSQAMADRYTYLPSLGLFLMIVWAGGEGLARRIAFRRAVVPATMILLLGMTYATRQQVGYWKDTETLFTRAIQCTGQNAQAHYTLGLALAREGDLWGAMRHYDQAVTIRKRFAEAQNKLGHLWMLRGHDDRAEEHLQAALEAKPQLASAMKNLGDLRIRQGRTAEAIGWYRQALQRDDEDPELRNNYGVALFLQGDRSAAVRYLREAIRMKPDYAEARKNLRKMLNNQTSTQGVEEPASGGRGAS